MTALTYYVVESESFSSSSKPGESEPFRTREQAIHFAGECGVPIEQVKDRHAFGAEASKVLAKLAEIEAGEQALDEIMEELK